MNVRLLDYRAAAAYLGVSEKTIWTLVKTAQLPAVRILRRVLIDPQDIERFIQAQKTTAAGVRQ